MKTAALLLASIATAGCAPSNLLSGSMEPSVSLAASAPATPLVYFMRAWRFEGGEWKVALDVANPAR